MVLEAENGVEFTPVDQWIRRGRGGKYVAMRMKAWDPKTNSASLSRMDSAAAAYTGKNYDSYFDWSDDDMYCSELVWKVYHAAGINLCALHKFRDYDFSNPLVRGKLKERFGDHIPLDEDMVSPEDIYRSPLLAKVTH